MIENSYGIRCYDANSGIVTVHWNSTISDVCENYTCTYLTPEIYLYCTHAAASVWTENINLALETAISIKAGACWVNCHNVFDAAAGFGGYRESGFGRDGGKEVCGLIAFVCRLQP